LLEILKLTPFSSSGLPSHFYIWPSIEETTYIDLQDFEDAVQLILGGEKPFPAVLQGHLVIFIQTFVV